MNSPDPIVSWLPNSFVSAFSAKSTDTAMDLETRAVQEQTPSPATRPPIEQPQESSITPAASGMQSTSGVIGNSLATVAQLTFTGGLGLPESNASIPPAKSKADMSSSSSSASGQKVTYHYDSDDDSFIELSEVKTTFDAVVQDLRRQGVPVTHIAGDKYMIAGIPVTLNGMVELKRAVMDGIWVKTQPGFPLRASQRSRLIQPTSTSSPQLQSAQPTVPAPYRPPSPNPHDTILDLDAVDPRSTGTRRQAPQSQSYPVPLTSISDDKNTRATRVEPKAPKNRPNGSQSHRSQVHSTSASPVPQSLPLPSPAPAASSQLGGVGVVPGRPNPLAIISQPTLNTIVRSLGHREEMSRVLGEVLRVSQSTLDLISGVAAVCTQVALSGFALWDTGFEKISLPPSSMQDPLRFGDLVSCLEAGRTVDVNNNVMWAGIDKVLRARDLRLAYVLLTDMCNALGVSILSSGLLKITSDFITFNCPDRCPIEIVVCLLMVMTNKQEQFFDLFSPSSTDPDIREYKTGFVNFVRRLFGGATGSKDRQFFFSFLRLGPILLACILGGEWNGINIPPLSKTDFVQGNYSCLVDVLLRLDPEIWCWYGEECIAMILRGFGLNPQDKYCGSVPRSSTSHGSDSHEPVDTQSDPFDAPVDRNDWPNTNCDLALLGGFALAGNKLRGAEFSVTASHINVRVPGCSDGCTGSGSAGHETSVFYALARYLEGHVRRNFSRKQQALFRPILRLFSPVFNVATYATTKVPMLKKVFLGPPTFASNKTGSTGEPAGLAEAARSLFESIFRRPSVTANVTPMPMQHAVSLYRLGSPRKIAQDGSEEGAVFVGCTHEMLPDNCRVREYLFSAPDDIPFELLFARDEPGRGSGGGDSDSRAAGEAKQDDSDEGTTAQTSTDGSGTVPRRARHQRASKSAVKLGQHPSVRGSEHVPDGASRARFSRTKRKRTATHFGSTAKSRQGQKFTVAQGGAPSDEGLDSDIELRKRIFSSKGCSHKDSDDEDSDDKDSDDEDSDDETRCVKRLRIV
ncbi:hypothetical protein BCR44DRAFT_1510808 [Catenaria anguillulae PL171]|uniref:Uncharacterized protein n=1 Tax=Catenaria anguillulae PL171 TaxID=765915 RepID=A0A1Y2HWH3_9FUNG|nr:hypothetical protein BCR44DRAFT_1510808 [Catenaria anguillulae PL171]